MKKILVFAVSFLTGLGICFSKEQLKVYTVVKGDTLAQISQKFYNDDAQWKKIHAYNKFIKKPHWIFPGDELVIPVDVPEEIAKEEIKNEVSPAPVPAAVPKEDPVQKVEEDSVIADENWEFDGYVSGEKDRKIIIGQGDTVFLDLGKKQNIKPLDRYTVYRRDRKIVHPETDENLGNLIRKIGVLEISTDIQNNTCTGRVIMA
ncbi:MAG: LysM peptidoglycan-binding domain-containing protein, partial [Elusimicrobiota bacterium]|nr:LysM peptidoglycan-binding domain-containing protein [Elusimicrobiota bacterium]